MTALCQCGCGLPAPIAPHNAPSKGWVKGEPRPFRARHHNWKTERYVVEDRGYSTPCWTWLLSTDVKGYGHSYDRKQGRLRKAHAVFYEERVGPIPAGFQLDHLCRNRNCVNPEHLEPVTGTENVRRGRVAKLTPRAVLEIRASSLPTRLLAEQHGTSISAIHRARVGDTWRDLEEAA